MTGALFDGYLLVDWSGAGKPATGKDSIWIAELSGGRLRLDNPPTRSSAIVHLRNVLEAASARGERWLAGFDFPFGYPAGLAGAIRPGGDWRDVWGWLAENLSDAADNSNDRFDVAARLNALFPGDGPFWGNGLMRDIDGLPRTKPEGWGVTLPANLRDSDARAPAAQEVWKLSGAGSVGGQALTGIAALERLRHATGAQVWPFESLGAGRAHLLAEVFPSLVPMTFPEDAVRDAVQVEVLARALARLDAAGTLAEMLDAPAAAPPEVRREEAQILGINHRKEMAAACAPGPEDTGDTPAARPAAPPMRPYVKDPAAIYAQSFATVRAEARLERFPPGLDALAVRVIHACGMVEVADRLAYSADAYTTGRAALDAGAPVICDCEAVAAMVIRRRLPARNEVLVTLNDPAVPPRAAALGTTRSAAAVELWRDRIEGAVVAIGNAPTALFHLLELLDAGWPKPALILGFPVGFVGAAESKAELAANPRGCDFVALRGRRGGSAMAAAAVNALSGERDG